MILSDSAILAAMERGEIVIEPFDRMNLGGNSYDVHLSPYLATPVLRRRLWIGDYQVFEPLDCKLEQEVGEFVIGDEGFVLNPGMLYLASTVEYTETHKHVPYIDGRSSAGRLGISIHETAGRGDVGFAGHFTLEVTVVHPIRVYAGMRIGQLTYHAVEGEVLNPYRTKPGATYAADPRNPKPVPSGMWRSFRRGEP